MIQLVKDEPEKIEFSWRLTDEEALQVSYQIINGVFDRQRWEDYLTAF